MPKLIDYPRAALKAALELAQAIDDLGGNSSIEMAAERLGKKVSGAFHAQISAATKYGLVTAKSQKLTSTPLYREIKLAYSEDERAQRMRQAVLNVPLFNEIYNRFAGKELPTSHFEKLLIREFGVPEEWASRVASYFIDAARASRFIDENNRLLGNSQDTGSPNEADGDTLPQTIGATKSPGIAESPNQESVGSGSLYTVRISGPSLNTTIEIREAEDLEIVFAMLRKVAKAVEKPSGGA